MLQSCSTQSTLILPNYLLRKSPSNSPVFQSPHRGKTGAAQMTSNTSHQQQNTGQFVAVFPEEGLVVHSNLGPAAYMNRQWFRWSDEYKSFTPFTNDTALLWWKDEHGVQHRLTPQVLFALTSDNANTTMWAGLVKIQFT